MYTVYEHVFPNGKRYFGITSTSVETRWKKGYGYRHNDMMMRAIKKYGWANIQHNILETNVSKSAAEKLERLLIKKYKSNDPKFGYNIANGGNSVGTHSETTKKKLSEIQLGQHHSPRTEFKKGHVPYMKGKHYSPEVLKKFAESNKRHHGKRVAQYDLSGNFIRYWDCLMDVERELGLANSNISAVCLGKRKSLGGYVWKYD